MLQIFCKNQLFWTVDCFKSVFMYRSEKRKAYKSCAWYLSTFFYQSKNMSVAILVLKIFPQKIYIFWTKVKTFYQNKQSGIVGNVFTGLLYTPWLVHISKNMKIYLIIFFCKSFYL